MCTAVMNSLTFMAVSSWPDSMLTVRLTLTSRVYSSGVLTELHGSFVLPGFHANCETNPDLVCSGGQIDNANR